MGVEKFIDLIPGIKVLVMWPWRYWVGGGGAIPAPLVLISYSIAH